MDDASVDSPVVTESEGEDDFGSEGEQAEVVSEEESEEEIDGQFDADGTHVLPNFQSHALPPFQSHTACKARRAPTHTHAAELSPGGLPRPQGECQPLVDYCDRLCRVSSVAAPWGSTYRTDATVRSLGGGFWCAASESEDGEDDDDDEDEESDEELGDMDEEALLQEIVALRGQMGDEGEDDDDDDDGRGERGTGRASTSGVQFQQQSDDDSSEDERENRNTVGNVPLKQWYKDEEHIGYDRDGQKLMKVRAPHHAHDACMRASAAVARGVASGECPESP